MALSIDKYGFKPSLKHMPHPIMPAVKMLCIYPVYVPHSLRKISLHCLNKQVPMIVHKAISIYQPVEPFHHIIKEAYEIFSVLIIFKNMPFGIAP